MIAILKTMFGKTVTQSRSFERTSVSPTSKAHNPVSKLLVEGDSHLQCPRCGASHLQQVFLKTYQRIEHMAFGSEALLREGKVEITRKYREQQPNQRIGTDTVLECEGCGQHSVFSMSHEKGMNWVNLSPCELL